MIGAKLISRLFVLLISCDMSSNNSPPVPSRVADSVIIEDTFAEAFDMAATRIVITAETTELARLAADSFCGHASSVIGCPLEAAIETHLPPTATFDARPGVSLLAFAFSPKALEKAVVARVGQNILTCPTTACFGGIPRDGGSGRIQVGGQLRYFGDGFQNSKLINQRRIWRVPVMDGEFLCEDRIPVVEGIGGGNLLICGTSRAAALQGAMAAVEAVRKHPGAILPFPSGIVRAGSKVGSKYESLKASTNDKWCPTLRGQTETRLMESEQAVYELVIDGLSFTAVAGAMHEGLKAAAAITGVTRISAGNYDGKLGRHQFPLRRLAELASTQSATESPAPVS